MKIVLYTYDMEPVTVIDIPMKYIDFSGYYFKVYVPEKLKIVPPGTPIELSFPKTVTIKIEQFYNGFRDTWHPMFFIEEQDLVNAFDLKSVPLAGQLKEWERRYKDGFSAGVAEALIKIYGSRE